ncbi:MAG: SIMPL domain-containing protein [Candidatus Zixiibacteriota bacterium]
MNIKTSVILALGIAMGGFLLGWKIYQSRVTQDSIRVVGAATKRVEADIVKWRLTIARTATEQAISDGYRRIHDDVRGTIDHLKSQGVTDDQITIQSINTFPQYGPGGQKSGYNIQQSILIVSSRVADIERLAVDPKSILGEGIILDNSRLEYFLSDLPKIKKQLLAEAMRDARARADEIAAASGVSIRKLLNSSVGVFQITEPFSTEVSDYGMYNTSTRQKDITVTVRASFLIE